MSIFDRVFGRVQPVTLADIVHKAEFGPGVAMIRFDNPLPSFSRSPQKLMREAQALYHTNPWIRTAESVVTRHVVGLPWHLEDDNDEEIDTASSGPQRVVLDLLERPQANRQIGRKWTRRELVAVTSRHVGLCGMSHWYLDQRDQLAGLPLSCLYINPARMWAAEDAAGNLTGWVLRDRPSDAGIPLQLEEVLTFYLDPPDEGHYGSGLVEAAGIKAEITRLADRHAGYVLTTGGRLAGIVSPKEGTIADDKFQALVREFRNVVEQPDAAKRTTILQGPIDFNKTAADPSELNLLDLSKMNRDDILAIWGVPPSQAAIPAPAGLNSGATKGYDEAILMQGAVHDRVVSIRETIQYGLLDRAQKLGVTVHLEVEEPSFDDKTPMYEIAAKATNLPLRNRERRELVGLDPVGDPLIDEAIVLPLNLVEYSMAPDAEGNTPQKPEPPPKVEVPAAPVIPPPLFGKAAALDHRLHAFRKRLDKRVEPAIRDAVAEMLAEQRDEIIDRIAKHAEHVMAKPDDVDTWWNEARWDRRLAAALTPHLDRIARQVTAQMSDAFVGKAEPPDPWIMAVIDRLIRMAADRVRRINRTTRDAIRDAIGRAVADGETIQGITAAVRDATAFDAARSELIARTETMQAYNASSIESYREFGVEMVEPIDGDQDEMCQERLDRGAVTLDEAMADEDHPNGTLDWVPVLEPVPSRASVDKASVDMLTASMRALAGPPDVHVEAPNVTVQAPPVPEIHVEAPNVTVDTTPFADALRELTMAILAPPRPVRKRIERDEAGRMIGMIEVPFDGE